MILVSVNYNYTDVNILGIPNYLMKMNDMYNMFKFLKQVFISARMFFACSSSSVNPLKCVNV